MYKVISTCIDHVFRRFVRDFHCQSMGSIEARHWSARSVKLRQNKPSSTLGICSLYQAATYCCPKLQRFCARRSKTRSQIEYASGTSRYGFQKLLSGLEFLSQRVGMMEIHPRMGIFESLRPPTFIYPLDEGLRGLLWFEQRRMRSNEGFTPSHWGSLIHMHSLPVLQSVDAMSLVWVIQARAILEITLLNSRVDSTLECLLEIRGGNGFSFIWHPKPFSL